jgi:hypothetical protein
MLLPDKYVREGSSLLGQASRLLNLRRPSMTVSDLWYETRGAGQEISYDTFILSLDLLYLMGVVDLSDGLLNWRTN